MSQPMATDELRKAWNLILAWCGAPKITHQAAAVLDGVADEMERARRAEQELTEKLRAKDATIEALADALWDSGDEYPEVGWHTATCVMDGVGVGKECSTLCAARRAALRLAGRLP